MTDETTPSPTQGEPGPREASEQTILRRERERRRDIREAYGVFLNRDGVRELMETCLDDPAVGIEQARKALLKELGKGASPLNDPGYSPSQRGGGDTVQEFRAAAVDALLLRNNIAVATPHRAARDLTRMSVVGMAETLLRQLGVNTTGMNATQVLTRAFATHSTSDFPNLLANVAGKALMAGFEDEPASHRQWVRFVDVPDFKAQSRVKLSDAPALLEVGQNGEVTHGTMNERAAGYQLATYGRLLSLSRQALINDDLSALTTIPRAFGAAGRRLEADKVYAIITGNPDMSDGVALFHASHGNLAGSGTALSVASLGAAKAAMRKQTGSQGGILNIVPRYLIVPAALETVAEQLLASIVDPAKSNDTANLAWIRGLELVTEPRLDAASATAWYLAASHSQADTVEAAYLAGQRGVFVDEQEGFEVLGMKLRAVLDFAAAPIDWTGLYKNPGA